MPRNYLKDIIAFQDQLMYQSIQLSAGQINLWYALMSINNKAGWKDWFTATNKVLSLLTGLSISGIKTARKKLKKVGLIDYKTNGQNATIYRTFKLNTQDSSQGSVQGSVQSSSQGSVQGSVQSSSQGSVTLVKQNKTKLNKTVKDILSDSSEEKSKKSESIKIVIDYLNSATDSSYRSTTKSNQQKINARLSEGFTIDDFKTVIDKKTAEWKGTEMSKYLRPETLFGTKFEGYLNETCTKKIDGGEDYGW